MRRHIDEAGITLAELADSLVRTEAISFRQAHEVASKLARRMIDGGMTLSKVPFAEFQQIFAAAIGRPARLAEADFRRFTTPEHFIAVRTMHGGPAPAPLAASFARYRAEIAAKRAAIDAFAARKRAAEDMLAREVARRIAGAEFASERMAQLALKGLRKRFGAVEAVRGIDLDVAHEEFVVLVGPSGCGKSTILRMIAGLEEASGGEIRIGERLVNNTAPKDRNIAMVFQNYALYPHKTVYGNMAFALRAQRLPKADVERRVQQAAAILGLEDLMERKPGELSGGQRQRVAMGRAIVRDPAVFLFDEPLSNLDAELRARLRSEIKKLHRKLRATVVYVTHDQVEAMTLADRIVILNKGRIEQVGTPMEVYAAPANLFVAGFIGSPAMNMIPAEIAADATGRPCVAGGRSVAAARSAQRHRVHARHEGASSASGPRTSRVLPPGAEAPAVGRSARSRRWSRWARSSCSPSRWARTRSWRRSPAGRCRKSATACASPSTWATPMSSTRPPDGRCGADAGVHLAATRWETKRRSACRRRRRAEPIATAPPWRSTISLTMARPRPEPSPSVPATR